MTEYTTSSEAIREYMNSRERTAYWVQSHSPEAGEFYSPSAAPSVFNGLVPSSPPSDDSSHSIPPKMVLRYSDGRPDIPIPRADEAHDMTRSGSKRRGPSSQSRSQTPTHNTRHRTKSGPDNPPDNSSRLGRSSSQRRDHRERFPPTSPEEIRILPSHSQETPRSSSQHHRSKSLPRNAYSTSHEPPPPLPQSHHLPFNRGQLPPIQTSQPFYPQVPPLPKNPVSPQQQVTFSQPQPSPWYPYTERPRHGSQKRQPPAIIYAPAHHSKSHYTPPAIYSHPPQIGANGMTYSHSTPQSQYPPARATPYPSEMASSSHRTAVQDDRRSGERGDTGYTRDRSRSMARTGTPAQSSPPPSSSSSSDNDSASTYYVLPNAGQKVHVIPAEESVSTATSTTRSPNSPTSPRSGTTKKPFFQRLLSIKDKISSAGSSKASSSGGNRMHRRHSAEGSRRHGSNEQRR